MHNQARKLVAASSLLLLQALCQLAYGESLPPHQVVEIRAVGMKFEAPNQVAAGWTTFRFVNASSMLHFAMIDRPPEGVTADIMSSTSVAAFQALMDAMNTGDQAGITAAYEQFPPWLGDMQYTGGPGFLSPGLTSATTVYLEPGYHVLECYVKTDGIFHSTRPSADSLGMLHEFSVTTAPPTGREPTPTATVNISNSGLVLAAGGFVAGENIVRVNFTEQQAFPTFVGNDVHVVRLNTSDDLAMAGAWLDWREPDGLETPAPVTFLGGINDMSAGKHGYIHLDLEPGNYALIGEVPKPQTSGFTLPFTVGK